MRKLILLFATTLSTIFYFSCQKEISQKKNSDQVLNSKEWFTNHLKSIPTIDKEFQNVKYQWDLAKLKSYENGYTIVIVPMQNQHSVKNFLGVRNLMICPAKNGGYFTRVFYTIPETDYFRKKNGHPGINDFTGYISFWDLEKGFVRGAYAKNSEIVSRITIVTKVPATIGYTPNTPNTVTLPPVTVTGYTSNLWVTFTNSVLNALSQEMLNPGTQGNPCEYGGNCYGTWTGAYDESFFDYIQPIDLILDMIDNPCLRQVLDKMNNSNGTYFKELVNQFNNTDVINVSLYNYSDASNGNLGQTIGELGGNYFEIGINTHYSNGSSEEDIAGTYLHEMIHAYLKANPTTWDTNNSEHLTMMTNVVDKMVTDLRSLYPSLPEKDAYAIAFNGLTYDNDPVSAAINNIVQAIVVQKLNTKFPGVTQTQMSDLGKSYQKGGNKGTKTGNCQ